MTDLEHRIWLCGTVIDTYRKDELGLETALEMLRRFSDQGRVEPYLSDDSPELECDPWLVPELPC